MMRHKRNAYNLREIELGGLSFPLRGIGFVRRLFNRMRQGVQSLTAEGGGQKVGPPHSSHRLL